MDTFLSYAQDNSASGGSMSTIMFIIGAVGLWKMFEKAGEPGWAGIIPLYRDYVLCAKVMNDPWYWLRQIIIIVPVIGWIGFFYFRYQIGKATAKAYGQDEMWAWGYTFIPNIFYCITGFSDASYYGPFGAGDSRTGEARQARTVDFDVIKEPEVRANQTSDDVVINDVRQTVPPQDESEVEFTFDQENME